MDVTTQFNRIVDKKHLEKTNLGFFYTITGVLLPFFISLLAIILISRYDKIISFLDDGQLLLFSVGLLTSVQYILRDDDNQKSLSKLHSSWKYLGHLGLFALLVSSIMYALLYTFSIAHPIPIEININFIRLLSIVIFFFSCFAIYKSIYVDYMKFLPKVDVNETSKDGVDDILKKL